MTITAQTSAQIKNEVSKIFKTNKRDLQTDTSDEGVAVLAAINTFLALEAPSFSDLTTLREALYTYQDQDSLGIRLYKASSDVQGVVKSLVAEKQFGYTGLNENLAYEGTRREEIPYADILAAIKTNVAAVSDDGSYRDLAVAIATGAGAANDSDLIDLLELNYVSYIPPIFSLKFNIASSSMSREGDEVGAAIIAYNILDLNWGWSGAVLAFRLLSAAITDYSITNSVSYADVLSKIKLAIDRLEGLFSANDMVMKIVNAIDAGGNTALINALKLELYQAIDQGSQPYQTKYYLGYLSGDSGPTIASNFFNQGQLFEGPAIDISGIPSAIALSLVITNYLNTGSLEDIKAAVAALTEPFTNRDIVEAITTTVGITDEEVVNALEMDFDAANLDATINKDAIDNVTGSDGPEITVSIYSQVTGWFIDNGFRVPSAIAGARELSLAIRHAFDNGTSYADILANIKSEVARLDVLSTRKITSAIASSVVRGIGASQNTNLIHLLELDLMLHGYGRDAIAPIASISGVDGPTIANSFYTALNWPWASVLTSMVDLTNAIEAEHSSIDTSVVTISSVLGSDALTTGNNTIIGAVNELDEEIDVIKSTLTITPKTGAYLNKCTMDDNGIYTVGGSVFIGFDPEVDGIALSSMVGLNTLTGYINAMAQCATWQLTYSTQDLYVSTTHAGGATGTGEDTGCSPALDFASAGAYCLSVFDNYEYA